MRPRPAAAPSGIRTPTRRRWRPRWPRPANYVDATFDAKAGTAVSRLAADARGRRLVVERLGAPAVQRLGDVRRRRDAADRHVELRRVRAAERFQRPGQSLMGLDRQRLGRARRPIYFAASGTHTLRIQQREDGAIVDQMVLSPSRTSRTRRDRAATTRRFWPKRDVTPPPSCTLTLPPASRGSDGAAIPSASPAIRRVRGPRLECDWVTIRRPPSRNGDRRVRVRRTGPRDREIRRVRRVPVRGALDFDLQLHAVADQRELSVRRRQRLVRGDRVRLLVRVVGDLDRGQLADGRFRQRVGHRQPERCRIPSRPMPAPPVAAAIEVGGQAFAVTQDAPAPPARGVMRHRHAGRHVEDGRRERGELGRSR